MFIDQKIVSFTVCLLVLLTVFSSCQREKEVVDRRVKLALDWMPNPDHVPLFLGVEKGFFLEEGIDLEIVNMNDTGDSISYLTSGLCDLSLYYTYLVIQAASSGAELQVVGSLIDTPLNSIIYRKGEGISSVRDLEGKVIGRCSSSMERVFWNAMMERNGITVGELKSTNFDLVAALGTGQVDAIYGGYWNIEVEHLHSMGVDVGYFKVEELGMPKYAELVVIGRREKQLDRSFTERFNRALARSIEYARSYPDQSFEIYRQLNPNKSDQVIAWERLAWRRTLPLFAEDPTPNQQQWHRFTNWAAEIGAISDKFQVESLF